MTRSFVEAASSLSLAMGPTTILTPFGFVHRNINSHLQAGSSARSQLTTTCLSTQRGCCQSGLPKRASCVFERRRNGRHLSERFTTAARLCVAAQGLLTRRRSRCSLTVKTILTAPGDRDRARHWHTHSEPVDGPNVRTRSTTVFIQSTSLREIHTAFFNQTSRRDHHIGRETMIKKRRPAQQVTARCISEQRPPFSAQGTSKDSAS